MGWQLRERLAQPQRCARLDALPGGSDARAIGLARSAPHHVAHELWEFPLAQVAELALLPIDRFGELPGSLASEALRFERFDGDRYGGIGSAAKTERETPQIP